MAISTRRTTDLDWPGQGSWRCGNGQDVAVMSFVTTCFCLCVLSRAFNDLFYIIFPCLSEIVETPETESIKAVSTVWKGNVDSKANATQHMTHDE